MGRLRVKVNANTGISVAKSYPKYLGSAQYMTLYNEALSNDGKPALYSDADIYNFASGLILTVIRIWTSIHPTTSANIPNRSDVSAEITGGSRISPFYANIGYYHLNDVFKFGEAKNNGTDRLNIRGNVDLQLNDFISAFIHSNVSFMM